MTMIVECASSLELGELLDGLAGAGKDTEDVEADLHEIVLVDVSAGMLVPGEGRGGGRVFSQSWREVCIGQR